MKEKKNQKEEQADLEVLEQNKKLYRFCYACHGKGFIEDKVPCACCEGKGEIILK